MEDVQRISCPDCKGSGVYRGWTSYGSGYFGGRTNRSHVSANNMSLTTECATCQGTGFQDLGNQCPLCQNRGVVKEVRRVFFVLRFHRMIPCPICASSKASL